MAAAAAPTSMPQARPRSAMEETQVNSIPDAIHAAAMGSVMAGSAFSARKTRCARPDERALRSCLAPTTIRSLLKSGKDPHWGILLSFLVSIQNHIIAGFFQKSIKISSIFLSFSMDSSGYFCPHNLLLYHYFLIFARYFPHFQNPFPAHTDSLQKGPLLPCQGEIADQV